MPLILRTLCTGGLGCSKVGDWFDDKTGWVIGAIIATVVGGYLMARLLQAHEDSIKPHPTPICKQVATC